MAVITPKPPRKAKLRPDSRKKQAERRKKVKESQGTSENVLSQFTREEVQAELCRKSFFHFVKTFWHIVVREKAVWNWHIEFLCDELQEMAERVFEGLPKLHDLVVNISPGTTKSTIFSIMFPVWVWIRLPSARVASISYAFSLSCGFARKSRDIVQNDMFRAMFPNIKLRSDQNAKHNYENTEGGERLATGIDGLILGKHFHFLIVDDPISPKDANSDVTITNTNIFMNETLPSRTVDKDMTPIIIVMQRLHENDPTGDRLSQADTMPVKHICLPAELNDDVQPEWVREFYVDGLMDPVRLSHTALTKAEAKGDYYYSSQFMQCLVGDTLVATSDGMVPIKDVRVGDLVETRDGLKRVLWSGETKKTYEITSTLFSNGSVVTGTPDHLVWTENRGFVPLAVLCGSDYNLAIAPVEAGDVWQDQDRQTPSQFGSTVTSTRKAARAVTTGGITTGLVSSSISTVTCGSITEEVSPLATTFITRTKTGTTIELRILSASLLQSITLDTWTTTDRKQFYDYLTESARRSMLLQQRGSGTGESLSLKITSAASAELPSSQNTTELFSTALEGAETSVGSDYPLLRFACGVKKSLLRGSQRQSAAQTSVPNDEGVPVYDLKVADAPEFFADGILVHNCPIPRGTAMFLVRNLKVERPPLKFLRMVRFWDKAGTMGGGAFTVGTKMGLSEDGRYWVLDVIRVQLDSGRREQLIQSTAKADGKKVRIGIEEEPGSGGKHSAQWTVGSLAGFSVLAVKVGKSDGDKEARADAYSSQVNVGNVSLAQGVWNKEYIHELQFFPRSKYKDQVDSSSGAFNMLSKRVVKIGGGSVLSQAI